MKSMDSVKRAAAAIVLVTMDFSGDRIAFAAFSNKPSASAHVRDPPSA